MDGHDWAARLKRTQATGEILRMVRAVIRDGEISELEAELLRFWLDENPELLANPPLDRIARALDQLLDVGTREHAEAGRQHDLLRLLQDAAARADGESTPSG